MVCLEKQWLYKQAQTIPKNRHNQITVNNLLPKTMLGACGAIVATFMLKGGVRVGAGSAVVQALRVNSVVLDPEQPVPAPLCCPVRL